MKVETNSCLLSRTVKSLASLQADSRYLLPFHGGRQKAQDSQERSKGFYYSWLSKWTRFRFSWVLWCPRRPHRAMAWVQCCTSSGSESQRGNPELRKPKARIKQPCLTCVPKGGIIILDSK